MALTISSSAGSSFQPAGALVNLIGSIPDRILRELYFRTAAPNPDSRGEVLEELDFYAADKWPVKKRPFFSIPADAPDKQSLYRRPIEGGEEELYTYPSRYEVHNPEVSSEFYSHKENLTGYLRIWRHDPIERRPLVFCVHGYMMGDPAMARRLFGMDRMFNSGLDVALYTQPHHWRRAMPSQFRNPMFCAANVPVSLERLGQTIHDLHSCTLLLREMGWDRIGMVGASLGGLTCALYATQPIDVDFLFIAVPLIGVERLFEPEKAHYRFPIDKELREKIVRASLLGTASHYKPAYDLDKIQVIAHEGDQLCRIEPIEKWVREWGIAQYTKIPGGHDLYLDRRIRGTLWRECLRKAGYSVH